jgi:hypothetical protein
MVKRNNTDDLTIREIDYSIHIRDKDKGFHELHDLLRAELTRFEDTRRKNEKTENPIREFLRTNIERSIVIRDNTRVYFLDYNEQGSFTIQFKLLVITRYINYGTTRQAIDYLVKDTIGDYFEELLERHLPVSVSVHSVDSELYEIPGSNPENSYTKQRPQRDFLSLIMASLAIIMSLAVSLTWIFHREQKTEVSKPADEYKDKYFELLIDKQVNEAFEKEKLNLILYKNLLLIPDTGQNLKSSPKK